MRNRVWEGTSLLAPSMRRSDNIRVSWWRLVEMGGGIARPTPLQQVGAAAAPSRDSSATFNIQSIVVKLFHTSPPSSVLD
uniref:Uncharacterized protein n=1 Tax=Physcomitrium patens TaxID=3218 RepID=A0A2K1IJT1_PHYPA|nr:hypothetical protein PHYPA_028231 [Physcomitrium patens]